MPDGPEYGTVFRTDFVNKCIFINGLEKATTVKQCFFLRRKRTNLNIMRQHDAEYTSNLIL